MERVRDNFIFVPSHRRIYRGYHLVVFHTPRSREYVFSNSTLITVRLNNTINEQTDNDDVNSTGIRRPRIIIRISYLRRDRIGNGAVLPLAQLRCVPPKSA